MPDMEAARGPVGVPDEAVRSIRIAAVLLERFYAIMGSANRLPDVTQLEIQIGEAQQIYPEIWRHLDDARSSLVRRDIDVSAYDAHRVTERPGEIGITDVDVENKLGFGLGGIESEQHKVATFNVNGYRRAHTARLLLMNAMPGVDWKGLERAEAAEIASFGSLRPARWMPIAVAVAVLVAIIVLAMR